MQKKDLLHLTSGEIDILSRNTTWTLSRDADIGLTFVGVNFYDGQGFMVRKDSGITSTSQFKMVFLLVLTLEQQQSLT